MYQLVCVQNGQYGFTHKENQREVLDHPYETYDKALSAATRRFHMLRDNPGPTDKLEGTPEDFKISVDNTKHARFTDHYFIEEV